jgi:3-methyladenine DNA glycosylase AlkD
VSGGRPSAAEVLADLRAVADPSQLAEMSRRYAIRPANPLGGIRMPTLRAMAKRIGRDHRLALDLWATGVHEARLLATMVADPRDVTPEEMESWVLDLDSWDICDQACGNLWDRTPWAFDKMRAWSGRSEEFVKRAAFALMAGAALHRKDEPDQAFLALLPVIEREAGDPRNFVRKGVNWALRGIGKRNRALNAAAILTARRIQAGDSRSARWVGTDALRELTGDGVQRRLRPRDLLSPR